MGRVGLAALASTLVVLAACGARTDMPLDERGPVLLTPSTVSGQAGSAGKAGSAGQAQAGVGGAIAAGAGGAVGATPCGSCVAVNGPKGCSATFAQCSAIPTCAALNACLVNNGCLEQSDTFTCGKKLCPSFITSDVDWAPFAQCAVCLPACQAVCAKDGFGCATPAPSCLHGLCQTGGPLDPACDPCVAETCKQRPQCCNPSSSVGWSTECAMIAHSICGACLEK